MTWWPWVSAGAAAAAVWLAARADPVTRRRQAVLGPAAQPAASWRTRGLGWVIPPGQAERLATLGIPPRQYLQTLLGGIGLGALGGGVLTHSPVVALLGAGFGGVWQAFRVVARYARWQRETVQAVPMLVQMLSLRLQAGEPPPRAAERVTPFLPPTLRAEWTRVGDLLRAGAPFDAALAVVERRVADRTLTGALLRLKTYHRLGVPEHPFGDFAEHLTRVRLAQQQSHMRALTAPLVWYALTGFLAVFAMLVAPHLLLELEQTLQGNPLV